MPNYRSLVGGFFSKNPADPTQPRTIRCNNPWALNVSDWQKSYPGFVSATGPDASANANKTSIYETPEQGVAAGWDLLRRYRASGVNTISGIINRYGGGQDYSAYLSFVTARSGMPGGTVIDLANDKQLLALAKAMFRYEAGRDTPWSDQQILYGFALGRQYAGGAPAPVASTQPQIPPAGTKVTTVTQTTGFWAMLLELIAKLMGSSTAAPLQLARLIQLGSVGDDVRAVQRKLREHGFTDIVVDGEVGTVTDKALRAFQLRENLDPDGIVGAMTLAALNTKPHAPPPPLMPPPASTAGVIQTKPAWYAASEKEIGFKEVGNNRGIERYIGGAKTGTLGDPWCAIFVNYCLEVAGIPGSRSPAARSFEKSVNFVKLDEPALGCIVTMWRGSVGAGTGHVFFYDGESPKGIRGIGGNEDNMVKRSFHERDRVTGYWWPASLPRPATGKILVSDLTTVVSRSEV